MRKFENQGRARWLKPVIPALREAEVGGSRGQEIETILVDMVKPVSTKNTKISWAWWCVPVIPATREAEAGELLEPRKRRLRWAEIAPLHSGLGNKSETPSQKKKKKKIQTFTHVIYLYNVPIFLDLTFFCLIEVQHIHLQYCYIDWFMNTEKFSYIRNLEDNIHFPC